MAQTNAKKFTLYYFPTSYSSQKVLLALHEKKVLFKPKLVSLFSGQHNEPWYIKLNPESVHVPVLKHGDKIVVEPEAIIDYVDKSVKSDTPLVPDSSSELGRNVRDFRKKLDSIPVDVITYGVIFHPHLSRTECQIPGATQRSMKENFAKRLSLLTELAAKHPDLRDGYLLKSQTVAQKYDIITDESRVKKQLDDIEKVFQEIEEQLKQLKEASGDIIADQLWLFGPMFTAADISLSILLSRMTLLGLHTRYFPEDRCPYTHSYYQTVKKRPTFQLLQKEIDNLRLTLVWENLKTASPYILGITGLAAVGGIGYYVYQKYR